MARGERPINNNSYPESVSGSSSFIAARNNRFARFRLTAFPTASPALTPTFVSGPSDLSTYNTTSGWAYDLPERRTRLISVDRVRRKHLFTWALPSPTRSWIRGVEFLPADVLDVRVAANGQAQAPFEASSLEHRTTICAGHPLAEAMHTHAPPNFGLICTLGHSLTPNKSY
jgi:hypothetical protein